MIKHENMKMYMMEALQESIEKIKKAFEELESYEDKRLDVEWEGLIEHAEVEINYLIQCEKEVSEKLATERKELLDRISLIEGQLKQKDIELNNKYFKEWHKEMDNYPFAEIIRFMANTPIVNLDSINDPDIGCPTIDRPFHYELIRTEKGVMRYNRYGTWEPIVEESKND
jgi:hypothetical protein